MDRRFSEQTTEKLDQTGFAVRVLSDSADTKSTGEDDAALALRQSMFFGFTSASFMNERKASRFITINGRIL